MQEWISLISNAEETMKRKILLFCAVLFFVPVVAPAQQKLALTIEQAIQTGLENSKALHTSQFRLQAADARAGEAKTLGLPSLKFNGVYSRLSDVPTQAITLPAGSFGPGFPPADVAMTFSPTILNNYSLKATLQQPLFTGGKISGAIDAAAYNAKASEHDLQKDKADVIYNIKAAYWNLYRAIEFKNVVDQNVAQMKMHSADAEGLLRQGLLTTNDVMKVQIQLSDARVRQIDADNNVTVAMYVLNNTIGLPLQTVIALESTIKINGRQWEEVGTLVRQAMEKRPEIKGLGARVQAGEAGLTSARGAWWPQIFMLGNYNYLRPNQRYFPVTDNFKGTWDVSVSLSFDVWNWWQAGYQTTQAQAQLAQAKEGLSMAMDGIMLEVTQSSLGIQRAKERRAVSEEGVRQAEENYRIMVGKYKQGLAANSELLDAEVALLQAKLNLTQSLVDYELAVAQLSRAIGE
jgi:outer membrane protein